MIDNSSSLTDIELQKVSSLLAAKEWKQLGRYLEVGGLDKIEFDYSRYGVQEMGFQMLKKCEMSSLTGLTKERLIDALTEIDRLDIAKILWNHLAILKKAETSHPKSPRNNNGYLIKLKERLKRKYKDLALPQTLWLERKLLMMEELYVELTIKKKNKRGIEEDEIIQQQEIFKEIEIKEPLNNSEDKISRRILVEGHPGYGKTTLVAKFLFDWSRSEKFLKEKFDLVFVIPLRNYKGNLSDHFLEQCKGVPGSDRQKMKLIETVESRVLLLLDGLDEASDMTKESLYPLLKGDQYLKMTVLVTCRTGLVQLGRFSDEYLKAIGNTRFEKYTIWDKRVQIKGISPEKRSEFLQKYLNLNVNELEETLAASNLKLTDFYECPLFLLLLGVLIQEGNIKSIETKTELYKTIFNFVINRSLNRESIRDIHLYDYRDFLYFPGLLLRRLYNYLLKRFKQPTQGININIFDTKGGDNFHIQNLLKNFGQLCLEKIKAQCLMFQKDELSKCSVKSGSDEIIFKLGFFSKQLSFFNYEEAEHYEPIHRSFLEFLAAFYLSSLNKKEMEKEIHELLLQYNIWPKADQLLYPFLGGFLQSNSFKLFDAFSQFKDFISIFNKTVFHVYNLEDILLEIPHDDCILQTLDKFSLGNWQYIPYKKTLLEWYKSFVLYYQNKGIKREIFFKIPYQLKIINNFSEEIQINNIQISVDQLERKHNMFKIKKIQCQNLFLHSVGISFEFPQTLGRIFSKIQSEKIWLEIDDFCEDKKCIIDKARENFIHLCTALLAKQLRAVNIFHLTLLIPPHLFTLISSSIENIIKNNKIEYGINIKITVGDKNNIFKEKWDSFLDVISNSNLQSISLSNLDENPLTFPLNFFTNVDKKWKFIKLEGFFNGLDDEDILENISVEHFQCNGFTLQQANVLPKLLWNCQDIRRLTCDSKFLFAVSSEYCIRSWEGFQTVERLDFAIEWFLFPRDHILKLISYFENVQEVYLNTLEDNSFLRDLLILIPNLKKISIDSSNFSRKILYNSLNIINETDDIELSLEELQVAGLIKDFPLRTEDFITCLEECFFKRIFLKFSLSNINLDGLHDIIIHFASKKKFKISSEWKEETSCNKINLNKSNLDEFPKLKLIISITENTECNKEWRIISCIKQFLVKFNNIFSVH